MSTIFIPRTRKRKGSSGHILHLGYRFYSVSAAADFLTALPIQARNGLKIRPYVYGSSVAMLQKKNSAKKKQKCSTSLLYKSSSYFYLLQVEVDSKKSTSLQVESK